MNSLRDRIGALRERLGMRGLLVGVGVLFAVAIAVALITYSGDGASEVTSEEFDQVKVGMAQEEVREVLGDPEREGAHEFKVSQQSAPSFAPGGTPIAPTTTETTVKEEDCWFYPVGGETGGQVQVGPGETVQLEFGEGGDSEASDEAVICFDSAQEVSILSGPFGVSFEE
jgi:hypothetical protein